MRQWRLIYDKPTTGCRNMAIDEAILQRGEPTLRLYAWDPACLSLGYGQSVRDVDFDQLHRLGWDVVRRPTGGRAILHTDELTYSLTLPIDHPIAAGGIVESYRRISRGLVAGLECLGVVPAADRRTDRHASNGPVCFETPSHYEITVGGRKLIGSAQVRRRHALLQHGSLPLCGDIARICDALVYENGADRERDKARVRARATTLSAVVEGVQITWQVVAESIAQGFARAFDVTWEVDELSNAELAAVEHLSTAVYGSPEWLYRR